LSAEILSGKDVAAALRAEVAERVTALAGKGHSVGLATVLVGEDPASQIYVRSKHRAAEKAGMLSFDHQLPADASQEQLERLVATLNRKRDVSGIIVQLPLPAGLDGNSAVAAIDPSKDADGLHPHNLGLLTLERAALRPATPSGIMRILQHYGVVTDGKLALVIGRSFLVGKPLALMLGAKGVDATVIQAHSRTRDLDQLIGRADILVAAIGKPRFISGEQIKPGAVVIDVGINRTDEGLVGDVHFDSAVEVAGAITPVPGGVGVMTVASLLANTVTAAEQRTA
jgi:methylenetetrahydrofolate dehydrogenase (NADP+)/methenyltetrahydrofolate cyclohydrolase